ncbi:MAG TPA: DUF1849 family protein [Dongiaceae bacterium]
MRYFQGLAGRFLVALICLAPMAASAADLVPHHATYVISLAPDNKNADIGSVEGLLAFDLKDTCDGWAMDLKMRVIMTGDDGQSHSMNISQVTWESKDGSSYRFLMKNGDDNGQPDQIRGEAKSNPGVGAASVTTDLPTKAEAKLPDHTLFPMAHTRILLDQAAKGESTLSAEVFDGTTPTEAMQESALIGPGEKSWAGLPQKITALAGLTSYPVGLAFYFGDKTDSTPDIEQFMRIYENGVAGEIGFDLGGVSLRATLDQLQITKDPGC